MCEWLSCREWCDVQLLCGGRTFSAHRAVLASVSTFLRRILLSCPLEETPIFIVLPDFDLEAMSSVLYYIYNGEVIIKKQKLEVFLDIIKALQIFMDREYLAKYYNGLDLTTDLATSTYQGNVLSTANTIFSLQTETCADQHFVNIKKGIQIQDMLQRCSNNDFDLYDKLVSRQDLDGQQRPLGNLQSQCGDRQRNSFLRDLFMETYPRNGNANGRAAGVLAISNERYRGPTSVLLTNANSIYPSGDDVLSENKTVHTSQLSDTFHLWKQLHYNDTQANERNLKESSQLNLKPFLDNSIYSAIDCGDPLMNYFPPQQNIKYCLPTGMPNPLVNNCIENYYWENYNKGLNISVPTNSTLARSAILNQVLESPWCPRVPNNYKPFRRKQKITNSTKMKETEINNENDKNNNIQTSIPSRSTNISGKVPNETVVQSDTSHSIPAVVADSEYKCTICDQVFTSASLLATHSRRHASTARYTCAECAKSFSQLRNFKYHMSVHRGTREFAATCPVCGKYFNDRGYLSSHMKIHRNRKEYKCSLCPKSFNQRVAYNMHVRIHTGVKPHVCSDCGKAFSRKMLLKQHQRTHSGERPYACTHCDKRFADRSNMTLHLRLHTGVKPFSCSLCPKSFTKKHHLKSHLNFHTGAKPYSCPRCRLAFTQSSNMRTHYKKCNAPHTG